MSNSERLGAQFRCCVYMHVRTGTIVLGVFHILLQLIIVSTLLMAALKHDVGATKSSFSPLAQINCQPNKPPTDIFFLLMHVVPGFTIFHKSHSDITSRFRDENASQRGPIESQIDSTGPSNFFKLFMGASNDPPKSEDLTANTDKESTLPRTEIIPGVEPKASIGNRCVERRTNPYFSLCLALISLAFGYLLVHGVISRQPAHLLPFFCLQVFDFVVALICMLGYMSSASDISQWLKYKIATQEGVSASAVHLTPTSLSVILISTSCLILAFKAYCIGMVWDCHRYLLLTNRHGLLAGLPLSTIPRFPLFGFLGRRPLVMVRVRGNSSSGENGGGIGDLTAPGVASPGFILNGVPGEPPKGSELPKYEEALSIPANAYAPPPYFPGKFTTNSPTPTLISEEQDSSATTTNKTDPAYQVKASLPGSDGSKDDYDRSPRV